jgi:uncharacterized membrane protein YqjE
MPERNGHGTATDAPVSELVKQLSEQTSTLVRQEMELARVEMTEKGKRLGAGAGAFGGAGFFAWFGFGALTTAAILALATALDGWLAALIVAAVYFVVAGALALFGKSKVQEAGAPVPQQAIETTKQDIDTVKARAKGARS